MTNSNNSNQQSVVTRFAPSPTGFMHIGSIRTALFAWLFARQNKGTFILRIEDTDKSREVPGSIEHIQECLKWLGLNWDFGPDKPGPFGSCIQSERLPSYIKYANILIEKGFAYPDPYTNEELEVFREKAKSEKRAFLFRDHRPEKFETWDGTKPLRLKAPEIKRYTWHDMARGELSAGAEMVDDVILIKSDGYPTYNFAHIIDDYEMNVTHVMRGDEFISSTPKFLSIYDALGFDYPVFVTLPPILRDDRTKKLGKRDGAKDILEYRTEGYLPSAMVNFLALIGWNPGTDKEIFSIDELVAEFSLEKIQRAGAAFNEDKLLWMNKLHLNNLSKSEMLTYIKEALPQEVLNLPQYSEERLERLMATIKERVQNSHEITLSAEAGEYDFAFLTPNYETELLKWKNDSDVMAVLPRLEEAVKLLMDADFSSSEVIKERLWGYAENVGKGELLWPVRVALSGKSQSPDPFTLAWILGREETIIRLRLACAKIIE